MFRVVDFSSQSHVKPYETPRIPKNIPYEVDNVWEWLRGDQPCRRNSAFAYATIKQAKDNIVNKEKRIVRVCLPEGWPLAQIVTVKGREDAKNHQDIGDIESILCRLEERSATEGDEKLKNLILDLRKPCLTRHAVDEIVRQLPAQEVDRIKKLRFWSDINVTSYPQLDDDLGEIFFEIPDIGYRTKRVE